jgi:hypothetical protein
MEQTPVAAAKANDGTSRRCSSRSRCAAILKNNHKENYFHIFHGKFKKSGNLNDK